MLFEEQTTDCLIAAIETFEQHRDDFDPLTLRRHAQTFAQPRFERDIFNYVDAILPSRHRDAA